MADDCARLEEWRLLVFLRKQFLRIWTFPLSGDGAHWRPLVLLSGLFFDNLVWLRYGNEVNVLIAGLDGTQWTHIEHVSVSSLSPIASSFWHIYSSKYVTWCGSHCRHKHAFLESGKRVIPPKFGSAFFTNFIHMHSPKTLVQFFIGHYTLLDEGIVRDVLALLGQDTPWVGSWVNILLNMSACLTLSLSWFASVGLDSWLVAGVSLLLGSVYFMNWVVYVH